MKETEIVNIPINNIFPDPDQPRVTKFKNTITLLCETILDRGVEVPIIVRPGKGGSTFVIIEGERRYLAAKNAGVSQLPCIIKTGLSDIEILELQLMHDCTKEKIPSKERDAAITKYFEMIKDFDPEKDLGLVINPSKGDWRTSYISKRTGLSPYTIRLAIDKTDFAKHNEEFEEQYVSEQSDVETDEKVLKNKKKERKMNVALEETARIKELKNNNALRKHVVQRFMEQDESDPDAIKGSQGLRRVLKLAQEKGLLSTKEDIDLVMGNPVSKPKPIKTKEISVIDDLVTDYITGIKELTKDFLKEVAKHGKLSKENKESLEKIKTLFADVILKISK